MSFREVLKPFELMYRKVEDRLKAYVNHPSNPHNLSNAEKKWFRFLIENFRTEFDAWGSKIELRLYFNYFMGGSIFFRMLAAKAYRAMGGAYLHISYDLPRVIADSLESNQPFSCGLAHVRTRGLFVQQAPIFSDLVEGCGKNPRVYGLPFAWKNRILGPRFSVVRARGLFLYQAPIFFHLVETCGKNPKIFGLFFARINRILGPRFSLAGVIGNWILALRTTAWVHGEILHESSPLVRQELEHKILHGIKLAARDVARGRGNVLAWPRRLKSQEMLTTLTAYSMILLLQEGEPRQPFFEQLLEQLRALWRNFSNLFSLLFSNPVSAILIIVILATLASSLYLAYTYVKAVAWADRLGEAILYRVEQQIMGVPTEGRQQSE